MISTTPLNSAGFVPPPKPGVTLKDEWSTFPLYKQVGYDQPLRPQFHFTSRMGWLNDPNGMVYYDGEWHLYDIKKDPGETRPLEADQPERFRKMIDIYKRFAKEKGIVSVVDDWNPWESL